MSFSSEIKEELVRHIGEARHCQIAELAAILYHCGNIIFHEDQIFVSIQSENEELAQKCSQLLFSLFGIENLIHPVFLIEQKNVLKLLQISHFYRSNNMLDYLEEIKIHNATDVLEKNSDLTAKISLDSNRLRHEVRCSELKFSDMLIKNSCCKRAFLRGTFLAAGSMTDPEKSYHMEFLCTTEAQARHLIDVIASFAIDAKMVLRKKYFVVYIKEGESLVDMLNVMEAHVSLMNFENMRIVKEMRNSINRKVNCEAANITKTVNAASKQVEDILFLQEHTGLENLPDNLREIAELRLENPDTPLKDLGGLLSPKVGKSGVYHRLKKIGEMADELRKNYEET